MEFLSKNIWSALYAFFLLFGRILLLIIISRFLKNVNVGEFSLLYWLSESFAILFSFGLHNSLLRFIPKSEIIDYSLGIAVRLLRYILLPLILLTVIGGCCLYYTRSITGITANISTILLLVLYMIFQNVGTCSVSFYSGQGKFHYSAIISFFISFLYCVLGFLLGKRYGLNGVFVGLIIGHSLGVLTTVYLCLVSGRVKSDLPIRWPDFVRYALFSWLSALITLLVWSRLEFLVIRKYFGSDVIGPYAMCLSLTSIVQSIMSVNSSHILYKFSQWYDAGNIEEARDFYRSAMKVFGGLIIPISVVFSLSSPHLVPLIYGEKYKVGYLTPMILTFASVCSLASICSSLFYAFHRLKFQFLNGISMFILFISLLFAFVPKLGLSGAAICKFIVYFISFSTFLSYIRISLKFRFPFKSIGIILAISLVSGIILTPLFFGLRSHYLALASGVPVFFFIYFLTLRLVYVADNSERKMVTELLGNNIISKVYLQLMYKA